VTGVVRDQTAVAPPQKSTAIAVDLRQIWPPLASWVAQSRAEIYIYMYPQWHATYVTAMIIPTDPAQTVQTA